MGLLALAAEPDWYYAKLDTMPRLPTNKLFYLEQKAGLCPKPTDQESLNVRMVGKWGGGPSWGVTGKDTLVFLSRGSEVVVINFADAANPQILNYIQAKRLAGRPVLVDTLLYLVTSGYIEVFNVKDPSNAPRVGRLATPVADIDVEDTFVYSISDDTFRVFDFADPANPHLVGACADSGYALDYDGGYAYLRDRWGMYILDVRDPANPHRVASWGTDIAGVKVRGNHCYVAQGSAGSGNLYVLNVSNPASPWQEGVLSGVSGEGIYLVGTLLFTPESYIVNIADSSRPTLISQVSAGGGEAWVHPSLGWGVTAGWTGGLRVMNLSDIEHPVLDTTMLGMGDVVGVSVRGGIACVAAQYVSGLTLLDVSDLSNIRELSNLDTAGDAPWSGPVINCESLAYIGWAAGPSFELLRVVDISDPLAPHFVGGGTGFNPIQAMVLRDTLIYCAEDSKFEVFNVADPRQPVWVGNCNLSTSPSGIAIQDSFVYLAPDINVINVARPDQPVLVGQTSSNCWDIAVRDTFCYVAHAYDSLKVYSVANPAVPRRLSSTWVSGQARTITVRDSCVYLGCDDFRAFDIADPASPLLTGYYATPYHPRSIDFDNLYAYVACYLTGVEVLELLPEGISEPEVEYSRPMDGSVRFSPNPVRRLARLSWSRTGGIGEVLVIDVLGRVATKLRTGDSHQGAVNVDLGFLRPGVYFMRCTSGQTVGRFVKP